MKPKVKVCCISSIQEAQLAIGAGASALGLVSTMPSGPGTISDADIRRISATIPPGVASFLLTAHRDPEEIVRQQKYCGTNTIQIVDCVDTETRRTVKARLPGISLVQVVHVSGPESVDEAMMVSETADAVLLDSGNLNLDVKELGGTGRTHDWDVSRRIVERLSVPVFLAGGLDPGNVRDAINQVKPYGLDLCSGIRTDDCLDSRKLHAFMDQVNG